MAKSVEFYWDAVSPYTYLAATQVDGLARRTGATVTWKPFLLGGAFEATGNKPPLSVPPKGKYMFKDLMLWSRHYGVPFAFPKTFPINTLSAQRIACALPAGQVAGWAKAVMSAFWAKGQDISQPEVLKAVAADLGLDGAKLLAQTQDPAVKNQLRANTDAAVQRGAFGAPTFFVDDQMFWGNDRLVLLEDYLAGKLAA